MEFMNILHLVSSVELHHYGDVIKRAMASQITGVSIIYPTICSGADLRTRQSSASLALVRGIHRSPVNSPHKGPVTREVFPFNDVIMNTGSWFQGTGKWTFQATQYQFRMQLRPISQRVYALIIYTSWNHVVLTFKLMTRSRYIFGHFTTAHLSWHVQIPDLTRSSES